MDFIKKTLGISTSENVVSNDKELNNRNSESENHSSDEHEESLLATLLSSISLGMDVFKSGIPIPIQFYEPMTVLQRAAEMLAYSELLLKACEEKDPHSRLAYVVSYVISGFVGSERTYSDFNPFLGETFEWIDKKSRTRVLVEQVSNDPPISALYAESEDFVIHQNIQVQTKFLGNSVDLEPQGRTYIIFKKSGDIFHYRSPKVRIHNVIFGTLWIEHYGDLIVRNLRNGDSCSMKFTKSGFFESTRYDISGEIVDCKGEKIILVNGNWNNNASAKWLVDTPSYPKGFETELWSVKDGFFCGDKYNFTEYAKTLLECNSDHPDHIIAPTDSRLRLDRQELSRSNYKKASEYKKILEEKQRNFDKKVEEQKLTWVPSYFKKMKHGVINEEMFIYCGDYWEIREQKIKQSSAGNPIIEDIQNYNKRIKGMACDFRSIKNEIEMKESLI